jgi:hypothetical protein
MTAKTVEPTPRRLPAQAAWVGWRLDRRDGWVVAGVGPSAEFVRTCFPGAQAVCRRGEHPEGNTRARNSD